jgi:hypothetical protein
MNVVTPIYTTPAWWETEALSRYGRPQRRLDALAHQKLEAQIARRRALATARCRVIRCTSERNIAKLLRQTLKRG